MIGQKAFWPSARLENSSCALRVLKVHLAAPDPHGDLGKAQNIVVKNIGEYRRHDHRESRAMGAVIESG